MEANSREVGAKIIKLTKSLLDHQGPSSGIYHMKSYRYIVSNMFSLSLESLRSLTHFYFRSVMIGCGIVAHLHGFTHCLRYDKLFQLCYTY
jgi:hypothetical protein